MIKIISLSLSKEAGNEWNLDKTCIPEIFELATEALISNLGEDLRGRLVEGVGWGGGGALI